MEYVEGLLSYSGLAIDHAWNCWNGNYYIDLTEEVLFNGNMGEEHVQIIKINTSLLMHYLSKTKLSGGMIRNYYIDKVERGRKHITRGLSVPEYKDKRENFINNLMKGFEND
jgi:hypothetical protein